MSDKFQTFKSESQNNHQNVPNFDPFDEVVTNFQFESSLPAFKYPPPPRHQNTERKTDDPLFCPKHFSILIDFHMSLRNTSSKF